MPQVPWSVRSAYASPDFLRAVCGIKAYLIGPLIALAHWMDRDAQTTIRTSVDRKRRGDTVRDPRSGLDPA